MKKDLANWIGSADLNVFATVTFKKRIWVPDSKNYFCLLPVTQENISKTAWIFRDRIMKKCHGTRAFSNKDLPPFLVFFERDKNDRPHIHILTSKPWNMSEQEYKNLFLSTVKNLDWVYEQIDLQFIGSQDISNVTLYSLKTGTDAFIPEASFLPQVA